MKAGSFRLKAACPVALLVALGGLGACEKGEFPVDQAGHRDLSHQAEPTGSPVSRSAPEILVPPAGQVLANVRKLPVTVKPLIQTITAAGRVTYDERRQQKITAWIGGRIERLYVNYTGAFVPEGTPMLAIYSPDLVASQREYLLAVDMAVRLRGNRYPEIAEGADELLIAARDRLRLWGITAAQIADLERNRRPRTSLPVVAPASGTVLRKMVQAGQYVNTGDVLFEIADLSTVWIEADVYESEIAQVRVGQTMAATTTAYPGKTFRGTVSFIYPFLNEATRTVRVRAVFPNPGERLKPGMYVQAQLMSSLGRRLAVPASAVLQTGKRPVVWVELDPGRFVQRRVRLGPRAGDDYVVLGGLRAGERVASAGGFLLDSEAQLTVAGGAAPPVPIEAGGRATAVAGEVRVTLQVPPTGVRVGLNKGNLIFTAAGRPVAGDDVRGNIEMYMPGAPMLGSVLIEPGKVTGRYTVSFAPSMQGSWTMTVNFKRLGRAQSVRFTLSAR